jgi:hypothetical protein
MTQSVEISELSKNDFDTKNKLLLTEEDKFFFFKNPKPSESNSKKTLLRNKLRNQKNKFSNNRSATVDE